MNFEGAPTMSSPQSYKQKLKDLGLMGNSGLSLSAGSVSEAKQGLLELKSLQAELKNIKREIDVDIKQIRLDYQEKMKWQATGASLVPSLFGKRGLAGRARADVKRSVVNERDQVIREYQQVKITIDDLLVQLEKAKLQFLQYIEQNK
jgi:hypothetical protein